MDGEQLLLYFNSRKRQRDPVANALIYPHNRNKPEYDSRQQIDSWFPVGRAISHSFQTRHIRRRNSVHRSAVGAMNSHVILPSNLFSPRS